MGDLTGTGREAIWVDCRGLVCSGLRMGGDPTGTAKLSRVGGWNVRWVVIVS
jgi:hypothetical protein